MTELLLTQQIHLIFFGAFGMICLYNLGYFIITKSATYASYFSFHATLFIIMLFYTGMIEKEWFDLHVDRVPVGIFFLSIAMLLAFTRDFLELKMNYKRIENYINILIIINLVFLVISTVITPTEILKISTMAIVSLESLALLLFSGYLGYFKKNIYARFYFLSFALLFFMLIASFVNSLLLTVSNMNIMYAFELAILLEATGLSFALAYKQQETTLNLQQNRLLFSELSHRMQNGLQQIISILSMQVASSENQEIKEHLEKSIKRISSISLIHKTLQGSVHPGNTNLHKYFSSLIKSYKDLNERVVFELVCKENIELDIEKLTSLALIVNELITNSLKYAFDGIEHPKIVIKLEKKERFYLTYEDNGTGFNKKMVTQSIGTKLIEILSKTQLKGELDIITKNCYFFSLKFQ